MATPAELARQRDRSVRKGLARKRRRRFVRRMTELGKLAMAGIIAVGLYTLWTSPAWYWHGQMRITGNRLVGRQEILAKLKVPQDTPLYKLDPRWIESQLLGMPAIAHVAVRRWLFPARLDLAIIERQPLVGVEGDGSLFIDQEGVVFSAPGANQKAHFPVRVQTALPPGERLPDGERGALFDLLTLWPAGQAGHIDMRQLHDVYLTIGDWPVRIGELQDVSTKLGMLQQLEPLAGKYRDKLEYIDLRYPASPTFKLKGGDSVDASKDGKGGKTPPSAKPSDGPPEDEQPDDKTPAPKATGADEPPAKTTPKPAGSPPSKPAKPAARKTPSP